MSSEFHDLTGKHAVITGGSRGIGLAIAQVLAEVGVRISVMSRAPHKIDDFFVVQADVSDEGEVKHAFVAARKAHGPVSILINNSGIAESAPLTRTGKTLWDKIIATNLTGTFLCSREAATDMLVAQWGRIVNISSIAGLGGAPYVSAYCASKHGVVGFTRAIAAEFHGTGVTANAICPGYTETAMMQQALEKIRAFTGANEAAARASLAQQNPEGRIVTPEEVADAALLLIASNKNGVSLVVPGGAEE